VLAAQTQDGNSADIWITCISGQEGTEFLRNTASLPATESMGEKLDTIYIRKYRGGFTINSFWKRD
jgi:hypothetical protein